METSTATKTPLKEVIDSSIKSAMLSKDNKTRDVLRVIKAEISREEAGLKEYKDEDVIRVIKKSIKNLEIMNTDEAREEIKILEQFIPAQLSQAQIESFLQTMILESGALTMKDMGKTISAFNTKYPGQADGKLVSEIVKRLLTNASNA